MEIAKYLSKDLLFADISTSSKTDFLQQMIARICTKRPSLPAETIYSEIIKRELSGSTGIGHGLAIPHCRIPSLDTILIAVCICQNEIEYNAVDGLPVRVVFMVLGPEKHPEEFLYVFAELAKKMSVKELRDSIAQAHTPEQIYSRLTAQQHPLNRG